MKTIKPVIQRVDQTSKEPSPKRYKRPKDEVLYYGQHLCVKLGERRRDDIIRMYCTEEMLPNFRGLLQWCAQNRKAYHVVTSQDLEKISGSVHHEGVAILAKQPQHRSFEELKASLTTLPERPLIYLDGVQNPHNIGTIMRVMASFGWPYIVSTRNLVPLSPAGARMSEGGAEFVDVFAVDTAEEFFSWAKSFGYRVFGTSSHESRSLYAKPLPKKSLFVLGHEVHGMSRDLEEMVDERIVIPATGQVESLNVSVATGILVAEYTRQHSLIFPKK